MPAVRRSQRARQQIEPYQAAGPPQLTLRQQRRARSRYRKTKEEIVNEEVRKVTTSRQVELLRPMKKFLPTILNGVMLGSKSIIFELENIASSNEHVEMLENFDAFKKILSTVLDKVCTTGIEIHQSGKIEIGGKSEKTESKVLVLSMNGKKSFEVSSAKKARAYISFDNSSPSEASYDFSFEIEAGESKKFSVAKYYEKIYIALYNIEAEATLIEILINDEDFVLIPEITKCPFGSKCVDSQCICDEGYIISRRPEGCMFDPTLTACERYGSRCGENSVCSVEKYAPYYECSCADGFIGAAPKCVAKCDDGEREIKEFLAFVDYLCKNQFFIDYEPVENNIMTNLKIKQNSQVDVNISLDSMLKHMIATEMPEDGKAKLEFMLGKNVEDFMLHFFDNGDLDDLFRDF